MTRLTDRSIAALPLSQAQKTFPDDTIPGFGVRVGAKTKTFTLIVGKERKRISLGHYPFVSLAQARKRAWTILAKRQLGLEEPKTPPFKEILSAYLDYRSDAVRRGTFQKDFYVAKLFDVLEGKRLATITPERVQAILDEQSAPWTRHYALGFFAGLIQFAQKKGHIENWPTHRLEAPASSVGRDRVLDTAELRKVLATAQIWRLAGGQFGTIVLLLVYTLQRRQQIGSLDRSLVDYDEGVIRWPSRLMKQNRPHQIPLGKLARELLPQTVNGLYFPNQYGSPFSAWSVHFKQFRKECGIDFRLHDLRRTGATIWQSLGIPIEVTERMLSHSAITGGLVGIYQRHSYMSEMRVAVNTWEQYLQSVRA